VCAGGETLHKFVYHEPRSIKETCRLLQDYGSEAKLLAGGTDLLVKFRNEVLTPQQVVNIKKIPGLKDVLLKKDGLHIGAAATMNDVEKVLSGLPAYRVLAEALHCVASCQIRNRATVVGNLCNASPAADSVPALAVLDAVVEIAGPGAFRLIAAADFCAAPGKTVLQPGEWVTGLKIPAVPSDAAGTYLKHSRRRMVDLATVGVALFQAGSTLRIALGAVAATVVRAKAAEELLQAEGMHEDSFIKAARLTAQSVAPITDIRASREYRLHIVEVLTLRGLRLLHGGAQTC